MELVENGGKKHHEIQEEKVMERSMTLNDYINIQIPSSENNELINHKQKRFLDFLKAHPSKEWFQKLGFIGRLSPFTFLRRSTSVSQPRPSVLTTEERRHRFRVPFVRKIDWPALIKYCKNWAKHPSNIAMLVWLSFVAVGIIILGLLMLGLLNGALSKSERTRWTEILNQVLNALFTIMCLYQHPRLFHHLVLLYNWRSSDIAELRKLYCKTPFRRPNERAHITFVVILLHITCISQYALCALYWGFTSKTRPDWAENLFIGVGIAAPVIAFLYTTYSPLGKKYESETDEENSEPAVNMVKLGSKRVVITNPEWIGGLYDIRDDMTVTYLSFFCTVCVFGWNMERLGFGNMYVHIVTFILLLLAPFLVFTVAALNINNEGIKYTVEIIGILLCFLGLLYGGFWRSQMRKKFKLPKSLFCSGNATMGDFMQWLFCWSCSLAQEVRTGNFYDVEDDSFCMKEEESARPELAPLPREAVVSPVMEMKKDGGGLDVLPVSVGGSSVGKDEALRPPLQPLIDMEVVVQPSKN